MDGRHSIHSRSFTYCFPSFYLILVRMLTKGMALAALGGMEDSTGSSRQVTLRGPYSSTARCKATRSNTPTGTLPEHTCSQNTAQKGTTKQLEANYELILALATTLNKHLKKRDVIGPESKDLATKCLDEVIRICEVCIRKEARRRDSVGPMMVGSSKPKLKGEDTVQGRNPAIIERFHGHSAKRGPLEVGIDNGETSNNDTSHRIIHSLRDSALPVQSAILSQLTLFGEEMNHPAGLQQDSLPCGQAGFLRLESLDTRHPLPENPNIFLSSTPFDLLSHRASQKTIQIKEVCLP